MKKKISKQEANEKIERFFSQKKELDAKDVKKMKRLAMLYNLKLGKHRKRFCKKCLSDLNFNSGEIRLSKIFKTVKCSKCDYKNKWKINL